MYSEKKYLSTLKFLHKEIRGKFESHAKYSVRVGVHSNLLSDFLHGRNINAKIVAFVCSDFGIDAAIFYDERERRGMNTRRRGE